MLIITPYTITCEGATTIDLATDNDRLSEQIEVGSRVPRRPIVEDKVSNNKTLIDRPKDKGNNSLLALTNTKRLSLLGIGKEGL
ncbi:hypothetical protein B0A54_16311 [Friedmanniomyces endolithicus]|uniref:Uncharacterized protein n=1 Tax=Friedmanniomyces endolithicus TaxID=329885 RepID=A0A4U0U2B7_9PEZI|nr:hypothetical protein B0A54_16311 [Friedmanniomyces endolithicus]